MWKRTGMSAPLPLSSAVDWRTVRALAHKLYTQCKFSAAAAAAVANRHKDAGS